MTEVAQAPAEDAPDMPSWSTSEAPDEKAVTPPDNAVPTEVEHARRLLEQLFGEPLAADQPPQPKQ
jgi:hypothetical protein